MSHACVLVAVDCAEKDIEAAVAEQMRPFDENGEWFRNGSRWDWYIIGGRWHGHLMGHDVVQRKDFDVGRWKTHELLRVERLYRKEQKERAVKAPQCVFHQSKAGESEDVFMERMNVEIGAFPCFFAFLRDHTWHESERMGWFGADYATECEIKGHDVHVCTHEQDGVKIISWGGSASWETRYYKRFIKPLPPETWMVVVDYHV